MIPASDEQFQELLQQYLANTLPEHDYALLKAKLESSPEHFAHYLDEVSLHVSLHRFHRGLEYEEIPFADDALEETRQTTAAHQHSYTPKTGRRPLLFAAAAALLAMCSFLAFDAFFGKDSELEAAVAIIAYENNAMWSETESFEPGTKLGPGAIELTSGIVRLDFINGVIVTLEGPARFEILSQNRTLLHFGRLTAKVPPRAVGFTVESPEMHIVDYGTVFGVNVDGAGTTETLVFRGRVNASKAASEEIAAEQHAILAGEAMRADAAESGLEHMVFNGEPFASSWPVMFGILDTDGDFQFVPPGAPHDITSYEQDEHVIVFPERERIVLASDLAVNITQPGKHENDWFDRATINAGIHVRSYLIAWQLSSVEQATDKEVRHMSGRVVFDHPIIGLITEGELLGRTSGLLGDGFSNYEGFAFRHSLELPITRQQTKAPGADAIVISEDRRSLYLKFQAMRGGGDFVRVVVDVTPRKNAAGVSAVAKAL